MKMQSCFSQLQHELEITSSSIVLLLDSTLKCILKHTVQQLADSFCLCPGFSHLYNDKWRALGSEILYL